MTDSERQACRRKGKVRSVAKKRLDEIAEYAETHDFAHDIAERGVWESDTESDPLVTTSLRLPKSLLDWVPRPGREGGRPAHRADPAADRAAPRGGR
jgi:hypothetical protein